MVIRWEEVVSQSLGDKFIRRNLFNMKSLHCQVNCVLRNGLNQIDWYKMERKKNMLRDYALAFKQQRSIT